MTPFLYQTDLGRQIADFYASQPSATITSTAHEFNQPISAVRKCLLAYGVLRTKGKTGSWVLSSEQRKDVADRYIRREASLKELAEQYRVSETTIHNAVVSHYGPDFKSTAWQYGKQKTKKHKPDEEGEQRRARTLFLADRKVPIASIAKELGISHDTVRGYLNELGKSSKQCLTCGSYVESIRQAYCSDQCKRTGLINTRLLKEYGITSDEADEMYTRQGGKCLICGDYFDSLVIDHDHSTGTVRGMLCNRCNTGIGLFLDDVNRLQRAIDYLSV